MNGISGIWTAKKEVSDAEYAGIRTEGPINADKRSSRSHTLYAGSDVPKKRIIRGKV